MRCAKVRGDARRRATRRSPGSRSPVAAVFRLCRSRRRVRPFAAAATRKNTDGLMTRRLIVWRMPGGKPERLVPRARRRFTPTLLVGLVRPGRREIGKTGICCTNQDSFGPSGQSPTGPVIGLRVLTSQRAVGTSPTVSLQCLRRSRGARGSRALLGWHASRVPHAARGEPTGANRKLRAQYRPRVAHATCGRGSCQTRRRVSERLAHVTGGEN